MTSLDLWKLVEYGSIEYFIIAMREANLSTDGWELRRCQYVMQICSPREIESKNKFK
jgi:hypothetical protein